MHSMLHHCCAFIGLEHITTDAKQQIVSKNVLHFHVQQVSVCIIKRISVGELECAAHHTKC